MGRLRGRAKFNERAASDGVGAEAPPAEHATPGEWPGWARGLASAAVLFHLTAVIAGALGVPPSSTLERAVADGFRSYFDLMDLGYSYRYYAEPPPTPVAFATLSFDNGRPDETVRLPARDVPGPRLRHQRQLALANALWSDTQEAQAVTGDPSRSRLARAYARHLCRTTPGCRGVTIRMRQHLIPDPQRVREALLVPGSAPFDLFTDELFTTPEWIGEYPCDGF